MTDAVLYAPAVAVPAGLRTCAHCGETLRGASDALFCCPGCASAHAIIGAAGLGAFYRRLEETRAHRPEPLEIDFTAYAKSDGHGSASLELLVDGLDCAACVWLIESLLARNPTVARARPSLHTAPVTRVARIDRRGQRTRRAGRSPGIPAGALRHHRGRRRRRSRDARAVARPGRGGLRGGQRDAALRRRLGRP